MKTRTLAFVFTAAAVTLGAIGSHDAAALPITTAQDSSAQSPDSLVAFVRANARKPEGDIYLAKLDSSPTATAVHRFLARRYLLGYYLNYDIDDRMTPVAAQMLDLAKQFSPDDLGQQANAIFMAYRTLATVQANQLNFDSALTILKTAPTHLPAGVPGTEKAFARDIKRYELIGKPAPALLGDKWYNGLAKPYTDGTTMIVFTANWCHSCRSSYPAVKKLNEELGSKGLQTLFAVTLDGEFEGVEMTPEQEFEANRKYFLDHYGFKWPVAIQARIDNDTPAAASATKTVSNLEAFALGGYPQFVIIDKQGIIRAILLGWDPEGNRERSLTSAITRSIGS